MILFRNRKKQFEELALLYAKDLFRLAYWRLGNHQDAEDVVQEAYLRAYRSFNTFEANTNIKAWLTRILLNAINDAQKKRFRQPDVLAIEDQCEELKLVQHQSSSLQDPLVRLTEQEIDPELMEALQKLPTSMLHPLLLREIHDMTYEEIAATLAIPTGTVMSRLFRARRLVKERIIKQESMSIKEEVANDELQ